MKRKPLSLRFVVLATLLGNTLEWYDYAAFGFLAHFFSEFYFEQSNFWATLRFTIIGVVVGSLIRPVSGIIFGYLGDRLGRKFALLLSIFCITVPTFIIGMLPTYQQVGIVAPVLLIIMRFLQGLAIGGELSGAMTFVIEYSPPKTRAFYGSFVFFGICLGSFLGVLDYFLLHRHLSQEAFHAWGWRMIFLLGGVLGIITFMFRRRLLETPVFEGLRNSHEILKDPIKTLFQNHKKSIVKTIGLFLLQGLNYYIMLSFAMIYYVNFIKMSVKEGILMILLFLAALVIIIPIAGWVASKTNPKKVSLIAAFGVLFLSCPLYIMLSHSSLRYIAVIALGILFGCYKAPLTAVVAHLFPANVRFSGISFGLNTAIALAGGIGPLLALSLIHHTNLIWIPCVCFIGGALLAIFSLLSIKAP